MSNDYQLVIGNKNYSSWSMRPWVWMQHHDISFETIMVSLYTSTTRQEISKFGCGTTVPILIDGDIRVWDSLAILEYLAEQHPEYNGWPQDPTARAVARSVSAEMHSGFAALRSSLPMNCRRTIKGLKLSEAVRQDIDRIAKLFTDCRQRYSHDGDWLFGNYSIVDAMFVPVVMRFNTYGVVLDGEPGRYLETVNSQSAVREWIEDSRLEKEVIESVEL